MVIGPGIERLRYVLVVFVSFGPRRPGRLEHTESLALKLVDRHGPFALVGHEQLTAGEPHSVHVQVDRRVTGAVEVASLAADIDKTAKKLANPDFVARAPEEVVEENRERLAEATAAKARLEAALGRLLGMG